MIQRLFIGYLLSLGISSLAWKVRALDLGGALAAFGIGWIVFGLGGLSWSVVLLTFFISSSLLSRLKKKQKNLIEMDLAKGGQRDWQQVLANGGVGAGMVLLHTLYPQQAWPWLAFCGAIAAPNADTWATEIGVLSRQAPRSIFSRQIVARGASGGVTALGMGASALGAGLVGVVAWSLTPRMPGVFLASVIGGWVGSLVDSMLGASLQARFYCPACQKETERFPRHSCGTLTGHVGGWKWLNNDWVNVACTLAGAVLGGLLG